MFVYLSFTELIVFTLFSAEVIYWFDLISGDFRLMGKVICASKSEKKKKKKMFALFSLIKSDSLVQIPWKNALRKIEVPGFHK